MTKLQIISIFAFVIAMSVYAGNYVGTEVCGKNAYEQSAAPCRTECEVKGGVILGIGPGGKCLCTTREN